MKKLVALWLVFALILTGALAAGGAALIAVLDDRSASSGAPERRSLDPVPAEPDGDFDPTGGVPRGLQRYYQQVLAWQPCGDGTQCAQLTVPLDYAEPAGRTIRLEVLKRPAEEESARVGSLVVNPGGPGAPGTSYAAQGGFVFGEAVLDSFDLVGFDPRGTGGSAPVDCLSDRGLDDYVAADPAPDDPGEQSEFTARQQRLADGCEQRSGEVARHVSTVEAAKDMDVLRAALGDDRMDYFGASYGTKLGATYADLFPQRTGRMVLDGAVDPSLSARDLALGQAAGFERALRSYVEDCVAAGDCVLGDSVEEGLQRIGDLLDRIDDEPLRARDGRELRVGNAFYGVVAPLYQESAWPMLTSALEAAFDGDGTELLGFSDLYSARGPSGYNDNSAEAVGVINCLDDPSRVPAAQIPGQVAAFEQVSPTLGEVFAWGLGGCTGFDYESPYARHQVKAAGAAPIVVIGTTRDPATPIEWAEALARQLSSGVLIRRDGDGHTGYFVGNDCVDGAVERYLVEGKAPGPRNC